MTLLRSFQKVFQLSAVSRRLAFLWTRFLLRINFRTRPLNHGDSDGLIVINLLGIVISHNSKNLFVKFSTYTFILWSFKL